MWNIALTNLLIYFSAFLGPLIDFGCSLFAVFKEKIKFSK